MAKQRLTVALCANLCGEKEPPLVIHTAARPRCLKNTDTSLLGVSWFSNKKAWMTCDIIRSWLNKLNEKMRLQNRKVLLFVDNAPCHYNEKLTNVELKFFQPIQQPMDQGVIRAFKVNYRRRLLRSLVAKMDDAISVHELAKSVTVSDTLSVGLKLHGMKLNLRPLENVLLDVVSNLVSWMNLSMAQMMQVIMCQI